MGYGRITGWGKYTPERVLTNDDLGRIVDTSDEWIVARTGIRERRIASDDETTSTMAVEASRRALERAGLEPGELDLIILSTLTPDMIIPPCANLVEDALGAKRAACFDVFAGCSGFIYSLVTAYQFISTGAYRNILVVGSDVMSRQVNWKDRSTCVLFGDGAGAVVVQGSDVPTGPFGFTLGSDGSGADLLYVPGVYGRPQDNPDGHHYITMNGREIFRFAVTSMAEATRRVVSDVGLEMSDIELFITHQANERIIQAVARSLGIPRERVFMNIERYGNTSAASVPMALSDAIDQGMVRENDHIAIAAFGSGLSWGAMVFQWNKGK